MFVGAGTVLTPEQAKAAREAGAQFIVAPGFGPRMVDYCLEQGFPVYPGICTPTEVEAALEKGLTTLKFFPAEPSGGLAFLKAIAGAVRRRELHADRWHQCRQHRELSGVQSRRRVRRVVDGADGVDRGEAVRSHSRRIAARGRTRRAAGRSW